MKLKRTDTARVTAELLKRQGYRCPLCGGSLTAASKKTPALDHDHTTGYIRGVLCLFCNGVEGKVFNLARRAKNTLTPQEWLANLLAYWELHKVPQNGGLIHYTHQTPEEKRIARNAAAAKKRALLKMRSD